MSGLKLNVPGRTLIYAAVVVLLAVIFVVQEAMTTTRNTVPVPAVGEEVTRIMIEEGDASLLLSRADDGATADDATDETSARWTVTQAAYPADSTRIQSLLEILQNTTSVDVITNREDYDNYGLTDEDRLRLVFYQGDRELLTLDVGEAASAGDASYARINGGREVVLFPGTVLSRMSTNPDEYRPNEVVDIPENDVVRVEITAPGMSPVVADRSGQAQADSGSAAADPNESDGGAPSPEDSDAAGSAGADPEPPEWRIAADTEVEPATVDQLVGALAPLRADAFPEEDPQGSPFATVTLQLRDGREEELSLWPPDENGQYPARASNYEYPFLLSDWRARRLLLNTDAYFEPFEDDDAEQAE